MAVLPFERRDELSNARAVRSRQLSSSRHLAERAVETKRLENRIVASLYAAATRSYRAPPLQRFRRCHPVAAMRARIQTARAATTPGALEFFPNTLHAAPKSSVRPRPTRGVDAGIAANGEHFQAGIIRQRRQTDANAAARALQGGIADERGLGFLRFGQPHQDGRIPTAPTAAISRTFPAL